MKKNHKLPKHRPDRLDGASLEYAPENEQGVVFLFAGLRKKYGLRVELIRAGFPDCIAYQGTKRIRIEFEFKSRSFKTHLPGKACDWLVCWEHNWPGVPKHLRVVELRREFGLGFNVWFQPVGKVNGTDYAEKLAGKKSSAYWSVPSLAMPGDLLLYYRTRKAIKPKSCVRDIFRVVSPVVHMKKAGWKLGSDYAAKIRRVCTLDAPLHLEEMRNSKVVCSAGFIRGQMQGRPRATAYWLELYRMIVERNPSIHRVLRNYGPDRVT
ncbi:MAG: hypothetical protein P4N60_08915 [Verrucomicrobiae bacterium]|nr:hypothetical protein [Verrucomicrobiae bacterium]